MSRLLLFTALALLGYLLLPRLGVRWQPSAGQDTLRVSYVWPGVGPAALEQGLTAPLEAAFALVRDVAEIRSVSRTGGGTITLELAEGADGDFVRFNVAAQIRRLYPRLPAGAGYPQLAYAAAGADRSAERPVLTYSLSGPDPPTELYRFATDQLRPRLSLQAGLDRTEVLGGNRVHWRLRLDPQAVQSAGTTARAIEAQLRAYFTRTGLGYLRNGPRQDYAYLAAGGTDSLSVADWHNIPLATTAPRRLVLGDLARVERVPLPPTAYLRINGENSIRILAYATDGANRMALATALRTRVRALSLPAGYTLRLEEDATRFLREELAKTRRRTGLSLGILLVFVLIAYRSLRRLGVVLFSLAVNLGLAFLLYWLLGVELNLYAFAGIAVSFGIMIDNIIIVLDHRGRGGAPVGPALVGATLTTLASLSVIWFLSEELRAQLYELARVMAINLLTSVLVARTQYWGVEGPQSESVPRLLPGAVGVRAPDRNEAYSTDHESQKPIANNLTRAYAKFLTLLLRLRWPVLLLTVLAFGIPVWWLPPRVEGWDVYNRTLGSDRYRNEWRPTVNKVLGGSFRLFNYYVYEDGGYRAPEETRLYVSAALPDGATLGQLNDVLARVEAYLGRYSDQIDQFTTRVFSGQNGRIEITFRGKGRGGFPYQLKNRLTAYATNFGGVKWNIYGVGRGFSNDGGNRPTSFNVQMKGYDQAALDRHAGRLAELLLKHPRVQEVDTDANINWWEKERQEFLLTYRPPDLARNRLTAAELRTALDWFDRGERPDFYLPGGDPVALTTARPETYDRWRLDNWSLPVDSGRVDLPSVASLVRRPAPQALHKENQRYLRRVAFEYLGSAKFGSRHLDACLDTLRAELRLGFTADRRGFSLRSEATQATGLMGLAVVLIFFICALLFESLAQALNVVLLIPVTCIGIFLTFYWFDVPLDQGGYVSFLLVAGLAVNGLILVVNEYNYLRRHRPELTGPQRYAVALGRKLLPIVLTIVSTAAGLIPFLLGGEDEVFWYGLAAGTIGGLLFSLVVLTVISPVFFLATPSRRIPTKPQ